MSVDQAIIDILPDNVLLEIFQSYRVVSYYIIRWWWKGLADVCRRWRQIIFESPHSLDLRLVCTGRTPTRTSLDDIWPPFPIAIFSHYSVSDDEGQDNIIAALEHHDRVIQIDIRDQDHFVFGKFSAVTQRPFPVLTNLELSSTNETVLHEEFLGGSVPCLQSFSLRNIAFPAFPKLALSATHLSTLFLSAIPVTGYISPEAMVTCLATLPNLWFFTIGFQSPRSRPDRVGLPPPTRVVLPVLFDFAFEGVSEYLEDLVARIDTPQLVWLNAHFFMDLMFHIPQLHRFIARTENIRSLNPAKITFSSSIIKFVSGPRVREVELAISCKEPDWQASSMAQVCSQLSPLLSQVEQLDIHEDSDSPGQARQGNGIDPAQWFELFHPFPALQQLHIYGDLKPLVARALKELPGERATQVLPTLRSLSFEGSSSSNSIQEDIQTFIVARQDSDYPINVHWE